MSCAPPPPPTVISASQTMSTPLSRPSISFMLVRNCKIQLRLKTHTLKPYPNRFRFSTPTSALSGVSPLPRISCRFGNERKSISRRNYLREKILEKQQQVGIANFEDSSESRFDVTERVNGGDVVNGAIGCLPEVERLKLVGESEMLYKLENWADQYKKDVEFWGVGSSPIFTVFEDFNRSVERVSVNEEEIRARSGSEEDLKEVNLRILHARCLAKELESGKSVIPRNSTVAKFVVLGKDGESSGFKGVKIRKESDKIVEVKELDDVVPKNSQLVESSGESGFVSSISTSLFQPGLYPKLFRFGVIGLSGLLVLWAVKRVITFGQRDKLTILEKGNGKEKLKSEKDEMVKVSVEVVDDSLQAQKVRIRRPKLDKQQLLKKMSKNKAPNENLQFQQLSSSEETDTCKSEETVSEVKDSAKHNEEIEENNSSLVEDSEHLYTDLRTTKVVDSDGKSTSLEETDDINKVSSADCDVIETCSHSANVVQNDGETTTEDGFNVKKAYKVLDSVQNSIVEEPLVNDGGYHSTSLSSEVKHDSEQSAPKKKIRIITSVKEARDYLSRKRDKREPLHSCDDILTTESASSSWLHSKTPLTGTDGDEAANPQIDLSPNNLNLQVAVCSTGKIEDSQLNKKADVKNDIGENESSAVFQKNRMRLITVKENQQPHQNNEGIVDETKSISQSETGIDNNCNITGSVENHSGVSQDNLDAIFCGSDYTEQLDDSPIGSGYPSSSNDSGEQSLILPKLKDPEGDSSAAFAVKELTINLENISSQGDACSGVKNSDSDSTQKRKDNDPAKGINGKDAATSSFDTPVESSTPSETVQAPKHNSVIKPPSLDDHWLEKNFHVLDPVVAQIRDGFRENYMVAQEKTEEAGTISDLSQLQSLDDDHELEWMKDDHLRDIVFKVRDNELSGREPFHLMSKEEEATFFGGLQKKVEQENKKLLKVHEYIHSNVENLNYGADGVSIYDPPEKVIPRWKGTSVEKAPDFLSNPVEQSDKMVNESKKSPPSEKSRATSPLKMENGAPRKPKIIIEGSDGSVKPGKKNGKEFWQHTKKWSRGFLELYNAETDPEVKATMKDMGKDLDRWITEEEIQEAAEWIEKMSERNKEFIQKKVEKIKREMELFGPQAVVSKYKEYSEEKEEDYLWWLDLPYVLCIEMYTNEGEEQRVGFYSLDMATDLELEPKPCHVIAFEDAKDCKNMCYIIQAHLEMLGSGLAFVVARPPKDTFRESKANGFNVTVIKKGEISLNIDQMLEEVEEQIVEIGSKMYHDQIMKDRGVDMNALMKGVIGDTKPIRRKSTRRKLKNLTTNKQ